MATCKKTENELRCGCGSLIARLVRDGVEIKCRRCKSIRIIPVATAREVTR